MTSYNSSSSCFPGSSGQQQQMTPTMEAAAASGSRGENNGGSEDSAPPVVVLRRDREKPAVPPKPRRLDVVRFSMAQARDDMDLDTILSELLEIENQLSSDAGDQFLLGLPPLPRSSAANNKDEIERLAPLTSSPSRTFSTSNIGGGEKASSSVPSSFSASSKQLSMVQPPIAQQQHQINNCCLLEGQRKRTPLHISDPSVLQSSQTATGATASSTFPSSSGNCASPDSDSAFCDASSTESGSGGGKSSSGGGGSSATGAGGLTAATTTVMMNPYRHSEFSSVNSLISSASTPSPNSHHQQQQQTRFACPSISNVMMVKSMVQPMMTNGGNSLQMTMPTTTMNGERPPSSASSMATVNDDDAKKLKIRLALEKMKEAKMKKVYVKIFLDETTSKGILVDERWTAATTMRHLAEKASVTLTPEHSIVEEYPHLHIKRIYEDHELVVENLEDWVTDSKNVLHFVRVPEKYNFIQNPQHFLLSEKSIDDFHGLSSDSPEWDFTMKNTLLSKFLQEDSISHPELEGWLLLKADGKKTWKKHYFVLRSSGLYYYPKGKMRGAKDLQCLMTVYNNQIYTCTDWKKKYKAPTNYGFAIKHPRIQVKNSKHIKYICTEDERSLIQWVTALRIIKNTLPNLYKNYNSVNSFTQNPSSRRTPSVAKRVEIPHISMQRMSALNESALDLSGGGRSGHQNPPSNLNLLESPARSSLLSRSTNGSYALSGGAPSSVNNNVSPIHSVNGRGGGFDQVDFNTIKRQPLAHGPASTSAANANGSLHSFYCAPPTKLSSSTITNSEVGKSPMLSSVRSVHTMLNNASSTPSAGRGGGDVDRDSDEEEELPPPPPPIEVEAILTTPPKGSMFQHFQQQQQQQKNSILINNNKSPRLPPAVRQKPVVNFNLTGFSGSSNGSNQQQNSQGLQNHHHQIGLHQQQQPMMSPPPPPKRAETTRILSPQSEFMTMNPSPGGWSTRQSRTSGLTSPVVGIAPPPQFHADLFLELQKVTSKMRSEKS